jgi:hypothetical protein
MIPDVIAAEAGKKRPAGFEVCEQAIRFIVALIDRSLAFCRRGAQRSFTGPFLRYELSACVSRLENRVCLDEFSAGAVGVHGLDWILAFVFAEALGKWPHPKLVDRATAQWG